MKQKLIIATRGSKLALWQANYIKSKIEKHHGIIVELNVIKTSGDKILDVPLAKIGGKGLFVKELETAMKEKKADIAVHSMKDVPVELPEGLELYVFPESESPNDAFLSDKYSSIDELPENAVVGTSSMRRKLQLLALRPDLLIKDLRGNVDTRIKKMQDGEYDAIILAQAGLNRMGLADIVKESIDVRKIIPAVCQGILGIEVRSDDTETKNLLNFMKNKDIEIRVTAERAFLKTLQGGCQAPLACHSILNGSNIYIAGYLSDLNNDVILKESVSGSIGNAENLGIQLAETILKKGGRQILEKIYADNI